jgi:hypothetical protein
MKINGSLVFDASAASEIQNLRVQKVSSLPTFDTNSDPGRLVYVTGTASLYFGTASSWLAVATGGNAAALQTEVDNLETSLGAIVDGSGTFVVGAVTGPAFTGSEASVTELLQALSNYANANNELSELDDVAITSIANKDLLEFNSVSGKWVNKAIGSASGVQAWDAGLDNLAALAGTGVVVETADGQFANRSLVPPAAGLTITNPDGVAGNPTFALANDLAALEGLTTTGYVIRTGDGTATTRSITGTTGDIVVTNGNGVASDTSIDLADVVQASSGNFVKVTLDGKGRVVGNTAVVASDITTLVDSTYVNVAGDTMNTNANLVFSGAGTVKGIPLPTADTDAANKAYVDAMSNGLSWKQAVRAASTANINVATGGLLSVDGVALVAGNRVLVKNQTAPAENGIYVVAAGAWTRAADMNDAAEFDGAAVFVQEGTTQEGSGWTETATVTTVGTDAVVFSQFTGGALYTWGVGLSNTGNTINVNVGAGITELPTDEVGIDLYDSANSALILTSDGTTRTTNSAGQLHLLLDAAGALAQTSAGLKISNASVTNAMLMNDHVGLNGDAGTSTLALGQTLQVKGDSVQGVATSVAGQNVTVTAVDATYTQKGVASFNADFFSVTAGVVSLAATLDDLTNVSTADAAATGSLLQKSATDWVSVSPATVLNGTSIDNLGDVTSTSPTAGQTLVYSPTSSTYTNRSIYFLYNGSTAATTHTVTHNLGQKYCNVTVVDASDEVVIPQSITYDSANGLTVVFNTSIACKVIVMGVNLA